MHLAQVRRSSRSRSGSWCGRSRTARRGRASPPRGSGRCCRRAGRARRGARRARRSRSRSSRCAGRGPRSRPSTSVHRVLHRRPVDVGGHRLEQHVDRLAHAAATRPKTITTEIAIETIGSTANQPVYAMIHRRRRAPPPTRACRRARAGTRRARSASARVPEEERAPSRFADEADRRDDRHRPAWTGSGWRSRCQASHRMTTGDPDQQDAVSERAQDLEPVVAVGASSDSPAVPRTRARAARAERRDVGEHVARRRTSARASG